MILKVKTDCGGFVFFDCDRICTNKEEADLKTHEGSATECLTSKPKGKTVTISKNGQVTSIYFHQGFLMNDRGDTLCHV